MSGGARINLEDAWPISNEEGRNLTGYTFTIENKCENPVNYIIALESLESTKGLEYLNNEYVKLAIDDEIEKRYGSLDTIENVVLENDTETIRETREVTSATVQGNSINEHTIRIWLSEDAPLTEQNKVFTSRVRITGGQGVENPIPESTADACFEIDENGEILGYDESCGESVVIPARVNGTQVKTIDTNAFKEEVTEGEYIYSSGDAESLDTSSATHSFVISNYEEGDDVDVSAIDYAVMYVNNDITAGLESQLAEMESQLGRDIPLYKVFNGDEEPELEHNQLKIYQQAYEDGSTDNVASIYYKEVTTTELAVKSLDLSKATYLNIIEPGAFSLIELFEIDFDGCKDLGYENIVTAPDVFPKGLSNLTFGTQEELKIGFGAFSGLQTDKLNIYTNLKGYSNCEIFGKSTSGFFMGSKINELNVYPVDSNGVLDYNVAFEPFSEAEIGTINVQEGITELGLISFGQFASLNEVNLPSTLKVIGERAFAGVSSSSAFPSNITIPNSVNRIGEKAFYKWPSTSTITFNKTQEEVNNTITFDDIDNLYGDAQIMYSQQ